VTAIFNKPMTLAGGNLTVNLNDGGVATIAPFSNAMTATGTYVVAAGQSANSLDTNSPLLLAAGATLKDALGNDVSLSIPAGHSLKDDKNIIIRTADRRRYRQQQCQHQRCRDQRRPRRGCDCRTTGSHIYWDDCQCEREFHGRRRPGHPHGGLVLGRRQLERHSHWG
jgi:hypothetical protein